MQYSQMHEAKWTITFNKTSFGRLYQSNAETDELMTA